ncbi:MAG: DevR family CRISPR-associated autoregulator [Chloroflexales bacterium]|nr:DevR family CRISPR-associated autoregulator [Chloroflexales bacterium]
MTTQPRSIYSVAISGRAILDLHALNNEGSEGNQLNTRQVYIVTGSGRNPEPARVNAISGDMLKHIQADHFRRLAQHYGLPLSQGAQIGNANRINWDFDNSDEAKKASAQKDPALIDYIIKTCALTDVAGILVTANKKSTPRKSLVEFGWTVGVPGVTKTESYLHTKYVADSGLEKKASDGSNLGQNLFHRPASSGVYAIVCHVELARVAYNDIAQHYPDGLADEAEQGDSRTKRAQALLESVLYTFLHLDGAHRNTQAPHIAGFEGVVAVSSGIMPAPAFSGLDPEYRVQLQRIADGLNKLHPNAIALYPFDSLGEFTEQMGSLIAATQPYRLPEFGKGKR